MLATHDGTSTAAAGELERLYDVQVELSVEIGRGEVVVIDEEFGLRMTDVTSPDEGGGSLAVAPGTDDSAAGV